MSPITHFLLSWLVANTAELESRDRTLVTVAGVVPDIDGLGIVADLITKNSPHPFLLYEEFHHVLAHNIAFFLLVTLISFALARRKFITASLVTVSFHLHLLCDIAGSKGPDGSQWPIYYLWPFSKSWQLTWAGQWELNAWPNVVITGVALFITFFIAWKRGYSPLELFSLDADKALVNTLRKKGDRLLFLLFFSDNSLKK